MNVTPIKTHTITPADTNLFNILDQYFPTLAEKSVVAITSKIVAICEGRVVKVGTIDKDALIKEEAQYYLPRSSSKYNVSLTITRGHLVATAGIDESNANGSYILWPKNPQEAANRIRGYLKKKWGIREIGVIITDSRTVPLRWGVTGMAIAYSGFHPLKDYVATEDLFGRKFAFEKTHIADSLATSATVVMGEGAEQTPIAIIEDVPFVAFTNRNPTEAELESLKIAIEDDIYAPLLKSVAWGKGEK